MATHSSVIAWRLPGTGSPAGCGLLGRAESDTTAATSQQQQQQRHTVVPLLSHADSATSWTAAHQASLSFLISRSLLKLMSMSHRCHPTLSPFCHSTSSCPLSFPASGSFPMSQLFTSGGQNIRASASVLPMSS